MLTNLTNYNVKRLSPWQEACGRLHSIVEDCPYKILDFGKFKVLLDPTESAAIKDQLNEELIGTQISILRTDIPEKPVLLKALSPQNAIEEESDSLHSIGGL